MCTIDSILQVYIFIFFFYYKIFSDLDFFYILFMQNYVILYLTKRIFAFLRVRYSYLFHYIGKSFFYSIYQYTIKKDTFLHVSFYFDNFLISTLAL